MSAPAGFDLGARLPETIALSILAELPGRTEPGTSKFGTATRCAVKQLAGLLLAAGEGRRFGGCKQLAEIDGKPLVRCSVALLASVPGIDTYAVLGANRDAVLPLIADLATPIDSPHWQKGLGASIAAGTREIMSANRYDGVLILLADQVAVTRDDLMKLVDDFDGQNIVASAYSDCVGVPAIFPATQFDSLTDLDGDRGARQLIAQQIERVTTVDMPNAAIDLDSAEDLERFTSGKSEHTFLRVKHEHAELVRTTGYRLVIHRRL